MSSLSLLAAFLGGVLALLSPCSALLLPSFFAYAFQHRTQLFARTTLFYIGLAAVLVPLGTGTSLVSHVFYGHRHLLVLIAGWMMIAFGVMQIIGWGFGSRTAQALTNRAIKRRGWVSMIALGAAYGLSGFCAGPILGSVLTMAAVGGQALHGAILLIDRAEALRRQGHTRTEAIVQAARTRLRPILMTTLTVVIAMLPIALISSAGSEDRTPMALVLVGGMTSSTLLTLIVVPTLYTYLDALRHRLRPGADKQALDTAAVARHPYPDPQPTEAR